jgi:membrane-bound lytic murein transglycosylase D
MLKSPLTLYFCSTFFLLPVSITKGKSRLLAPADHVEKKVMNAVAVTPKTQLNRQGMLFVKTYIRKSNRNLTAIKRRSGSSFSIIDSIFSLYKLPRELRYLAVIESELKPTAISHVGAVGPWQLMPATARILGLKISSRNDERRNYYKSTRAAARYLRDLQKEFGDWLLVVAAYNGGPAMVHYAMKKSHSQNFWVLQGYLPAESRQHVKRFIATQYFFEGQGSLTTLTKAEGVQYTKRINALGACTVKEPLAVETAQKEQVIGTALKEQTTENKFERLMRESEDLLRKSNQLLEKGN